MPGAVDAYLTLLETLGTKTISEVLAPALHYAERGFPMYEYMHRLLAIPETRSQFDVYPPGGTAVFYPGGRVPRGGRAVRAAGAGRHAAQARRGRRAGRATIARPASPPRASASIAGDVAATIGAFSERLGGLLRASDLAGYRARLEPPVRDGVRRARDRRAGRVDAGAGAPAGARHAGHASTCARSATTRARYIHVVTEALKLAFADRERYYGDCRRASRLPSCCRRPTARSAPRSSVTDRAMPEAPAARRSARARRRRVGAPVTPGARGTGVAAGGADGTTHIAAIDRDGNMVCLTPSGGVFRKSAFAPELGCTLSTRSEMFVLEDGHPNALAPGKRPRTTLVSYLICEDGVPTTTVGCPGGDDQAQADLQIVLNLLVFGMNPQQAVEAPRFSTQTLVNSFYPRAYRPGQLNVEPGIPESTRAELRALGHSVSEIGACGIGAVVTRRDPASGVLSAGADPRRPTYALAW